MPSSFRYTKFRAGFALTPNKQALYARFARRTPQPLRGLGAAGPDRCAAKEMRNQVPEISRYLDIIIAMYYDDHAPPHFHAKYGDCEMKVDIQVGR